MTRLVSRLCAGGLAAALLIGSVSAAHAQHRHRHHHGGNAAGAAAVGLLGGLVIGGIIANSQPAYAGPAPVYAVPARNPHTDWCYSNTLGYNPYDNTSQGYYAGERVYCRSPYGG
ncbi:MAG: hypothetical protein FJX54_07985 [Alphaproteobacteria bacterium]|nr:hypothetical protein [Alphaproteobacteria bacterium]